MSAALFRAAMEAAADHIERNPASYNFMDNGLPHRERNTACMWGWTGHYARRMGVEVGRGYDNVSLARALGVYWTGELYNLMPPGRLNDAPTRAATAMRRFAAARWPMEPAYVAFKAKLLEGAHETA